MCGTHAMLRGVEHLGASRLKRILLKSLLGLLAFGLAVVLAWVACNGPWADAEPRPTPAELMPRAVTLAPERNGFFDLVGITAPAGEDIHAVGLADWQNGFEHERQRLEWPRLKAPDCEIADSKCMAEWSQRAPEMRRWLAESALMGARCEQARSMEGIEEVPVPAAFSLDEVVPTPGLMRFAPAAGCTLWWTVQAVLAASPTEALDALTRADEFARKGLAGARSLVGKMVFGASLKRQWLLVARLAAGEAGEGVAGRARFEPLLRPLPPGSLSLRAWAGSELQFQRDSIATIRDIGVRCRLDDQEESAVRWWAQQFCRSGLGYLPELTEQTFEAQWLARLATARADGLVSCEALSRPPWRDDPSELQPYSWRNSIGQILLVVSNGAFRDYPARQLDLELLRLTLRAQLLGEPMPQGVLLRREGETLRWAGCQAGMVEGRTQGVLILPVL